MSIKKELLDKGIDPGIVGGFITSLIMVHTFSIPIEIKELGFKFAITRNVLSFIFAITIGFIIAYIY